MKIGDAAERLNVTPQTIRKYIKQGKLKATKTREGKGPYRYLITDEDLLNYQLETLPEPNNTDTAAKQVKQSTSNTKTEQVSSSLDSLVDLLREQVARNERLTETTTTFQLKNQQLEDKVLQLEEQIQKLLPPPSDEEEQTPAEQKRLWWTLWLKKGA